MHVWGWQDTCRPKNEGGLGIRRLSDINKATGVRLAWRLCNSNSLWAQWMRDYYMLEKHLSQASSTILHSGTWEWVCSLKNETLLLHMARVLGNGKKKLSAT